MIKLYAIPTCPYCAQVRNKLNELSVPFEEITVPYEREKRAEVFKLSGQYFVPVIQDGDKILDDEVKIIPYLDTTYGKH